MSVQNVSAAAAHVAAATQSAKPQSTPATAAKSKVTPPTAASVDRDGDHDGSGSGRLNVKA